MTPIEAARLGKSLEPYALFWMEDATPAENQANFRLIRQHTVTPLAVGEVFNTIWDCKQLVEEQLIDYIRTTVVHAGGITHLRRIADFAALHNVRLGCHGATDLSPVCMGASLHLNTAIPNFGIQEYMRHTPETDAVFPHDYQFAAGRLHAGERPGHGVDIDEGWRRSIPISALIYRSIASRTARCGTGEREPPCACAGRPVSRIAAPTELLDRERGAVGVGCGRRRIPLTPKFSCVPV